MHSNASIKSNRYSFDSVFYPSWLALRNGSGCSRSRDFIYVYRNKESYLQGGREPATP